MSGNPNPELERRRTRRAEAQILRREFDALWNYAREAHRESGRGCLLVGWSRSLAELQGDKRASFLLLDYFSETELCDVVNSPAENVDSADSIQTTFTLVQTYAPAFECIAVFLGAGGWGKTYRLSRVRENEKLFRRVRRAR